MPHDKIFTAMGSDARTERARALNEFLTELENHLKNDDIPRALASIAGMRRVIDRAVRVPTPTPPGA